MQKKLVQSSLALVASAALGLSGAFVAGPAMADDAKPEINVSTDAGVQSAFGKITKANGELPAEVGRVGVEGDTLNIGVSKMTPEVKALAAKYSNVNVVVDAQFTAGQAYASTPILGGVGYLLESAEGTSVCSTGFPGWDKAGNPIVLTAGHCAEGTTISDTENVEFAPGNGGTEPRRNSDGPVGTWGFHQYGTSTVDRDPAEAYDFAVIKLDPKFSPKPAIYKWKTGGTDPIKNVGDAFNRKGELSIAGTTVHSSGRTTGFTTGVVSQKYNEDFQYANIGGRLVHGFEVSSQGTPFSAPGDSGGAVYSGTKALGVISGGPADNDPNAGQWAWVADLQNSLDRSGQTISFKDPHPTPKAPAIKNTTVQPGGTVTGTAEAGTTVKITRASADPITVNVGADKKVSFSAPNEPGKYRYSATATRDGKTSAAKKFTVTVEKKATPVAPDVPVLQGATISPEGQISGTTSANAEVTVNWTPAADANSAHSAFIGEAQAAPAVGQATTTADADGKFSVAGPADPGTYTVTATATKDGATSAQSEPVTVIVEAAEEPDDNAKANGSSAADTSAGNKDGTSQADAAEGDKDGTSQADAAEGDKDGTSQTDGAKSNSDGTSKADDSKDGSDVTAKRSISVTPKKVVDTDFVNSKKGVTITVKGFDEGEKVSLKVVAGPDNVKGITLTESANKDGVAVFNVYGVNSSDPSVYRGTYDVSVTGANDTADEKALTGQFTVVSAEDNNGGGSDDGKGGNGGADLPRTGAELTGLWGGTGLLLLGGGAVVLTMRRNKKN